MTTAEIEKRHQIQRTAKAIDYHIEALGLIPNYPENGSARSVQEKQLAEALASMKGLLNGGAK